MKAGILEKSSRVKQSPERPTSIRITSIHRIRLKDNLIVYRRLQMNLGRKFRCSSLVMTEEDKHSMRQYELFRKKSLKLLC